MGVTTLVENGQHNTKTRDMQSCVIYPGERHIGFVYSEDGKGMCSPFWLAARTILSNYVPKEKLHCNSQIIPIVDVTKFVTFRSVHQERHSQPPSTGAQDGLTVPAMSRRGPVQYQWGLHGKSKSCLISDKLFFLLLAITVILIFHFDSVSRTEWWPWWSGIGR